MTQIENAILFATNAHADTRRKGKNRPYILHPLEAMVIVAGLTDDEDVIAAAVLHDTLEDTETEAEAIEREFGGKVLELVAAESEDKMRSVSAEASWEARKQATINHLGTLSRDAKLIYLGDKLANIREMSRDYAQLGDTLWERFNQKDKSMHAWYYRSIYALMAEEFGNIPPIREYRELLQTVFRE